MTVIWSGFTEEGAVVPVQVDGAGRVVATTGEPPGPPVIEYNGASAWGNVAADGTINNGLNVASVTLNGTGNYDVVFTTPMGTGSYSITGSTGRNSNNLFVYYDQTPTGFSYQTISSDNAAKVDEPVSFAVFSSNALPPMGGTGTDAWGTCDGNGNVLSSFNVASVVRASDGTYLVTFTTPLPTDTYAVNATPNITSGTVGWFCQVYDKTTQGCEVAVVNFEGSRGDVGFAFTVNATNAVLPVTVTAEQLNAVTNNWYLENDDQVLTTRYKVDMQEGIVFAGGKAGITRDGELYFTSNGGKYVIAVSDEQIGLTRIDSAY